MSRYEKRIADYAALIKWASRQIEKIQAEEIEMSKFADAINKLKQDKDGVETQLAAAQAELTKIKTELPDQADHDAANSVLAPVTILPPAK